jgi:hypothetical protein
MLAAEEAMIGFLHKKTTGHIQRWKRRYCELAAGGRFIKIFHEEHSRRSQQQQQQPPHAETAGLKGVVDLLNVVTVEQEDALISISTTDPKTGATTAVELRAADGAEAARWVARVRASAAAGRQMQGQRGRYAGRRSVTGTSLGIAEVEVTLTRSGAGGLGLELGEHRNGLARRGTICAADGVKTMVEQVRSGTPAAASGQVQRGDTLVEVDGACIRGLTLEEVLARLRGAPRTVVQLVLLRHSTQSDVAAAAAAASAASAAAAEEGGEAVASAAGAPVGGAVAGGGGSSSGGSNGSGSGSKGGSGGGGGGDGGGGGGADDEDAARRDSAAESADAAEFENDAALWEPYQLPSGAAYYIHQVTREVSWEPPPAPAAADAAASASASASAPSSSSAGASSSHPQPAPALSSAAEVWSEHTDPATGQAYFVHTDTGQSSWTKPAAKPVSVAGRGALAALGGDWKSRRDSTSGRGYWVNEEGAVVLKEEGGGAAGAAGAAGAGAAASASAPPCPAAAGEEGFDEAQWDRRDDPVSGQAYFVHKVTKRVEWAPLDAPPPPAPAPSPQQGALAAAPASLARTAEAAEAAEAAEGGWEVAQDPASGWPYYVHRDTGQTSWELPTGATAVDGGPAGDGAATTNDGDDGGNDGGGGDDDDAAGGPATEEALATAAAAVSGRQVAALRAEAALWTARHDPVTESSYFVHAHTKQVKWSTPAVVLEAAEALAAQAPVPPPPAAALSPAPPRGAASGRAGARGEPPLSQAGAPKPQLPQLRPLAAPSSATATDQRITAGRFVSVPGIGGVPISIRTQGYLLKKGSMRHNWQRRWFMLDAAKGELKYYDKKVASDGAGSSLLFKGVLCLDQAMKLGTPASKHAFLFEVEAAGHHGVKAQKAARVYQVSVPRRSACSASLVARPPASVRSGSYPLPPAAVRPLFCPLALLSVGAASGRVAGGL